MADLEPQSHCSSCGAAYPSGLNWPRQCPDCGNTVYRNPLPVAVALLPVRGTPGNGAGAGPASGPGPGIRTGTGLVVIRRTIEPGRGGMALPGGFIDHGEDWRDAVAREFREETGIPADPGQVRLADALSSPAGHLLIFGLFPELSAEDLPPSVPTDETEGWEILERPAQLVFPLHTLAARAWFDGRYDHLPAPWPVP
ncbi:NUDIX domain-containing protein [Streptomyces sp. NPDC004647]|uniref:NUDIX domain-containing protein n=1 Tax=Streptomyces sp. NPDC004647 TaxID=3154671 RepID=UPI0033B2A425